jgi:hypothetical protein
MCAEEVKSLVEGWALVDNTQNEDWRDVALSLVSGASNSFIYDLYNPRFAARTEVRQPISFTRAPGPRYSPHFNVTSIQIEVEQEETLAPPVLEDAVAQRNVSELSEATATRDERMLLPPQ